MLNPFSISGLLILSTSSIMAVVMLAGERARIQVMWGLFCILVAIWGLGAYEIGSATNAVNGLLWWKLSYIGVIFIPAGFTHFVYEFLGKKDRWLIYLLYLISFGYLVSDLWGNLYMAQVHLISGPLWYLLPTPLFDSFFVLWIVIIIYTNILLFIEYLKTTGDRHLQTGYFVLATAFGFFMGSFCFLPIYGINLYPWENNAVCLYPVVMGYAVVKYRLMSLKFVAAQVFVTALAIFLFVRTVSEPFGSSDQIIDAIVFATSVVVGLLLVRSVYREIEQRERSDKLAKELDKSNSDLEDLSKHLQQKVDEQTKEIRQSYEVEKKARIELEQLDKNKNQFILATQHHLRTPLTIIKGYVESLLALPPQESLEQAKPMLQKTEVATDRLSSLVSELLDISQMQAGKNLLNKAEVDPRAMIEEIFSDMSGEMDKKHVTKDLDFQEVRLRLDPVRMKEAFTNLIDNAVKYCNEGGKITIRGDKENEVYKLTFQDTGIGLTQPELERAFTQYFERGEEAEKMNTTGRGIGLVVTKNIIEAHGGKIGVESEGRGKGSKFTIELPLKS